MGKTLSFVALDFRAIKPYYRSILLLAVMGIAMGFMFKSISMLVTFFMVSLILIMSYPFTISEKNGLETLYSTLSLNRKTVVYGRYLFVLALEAICAALMILCSFLFAQVLGLDFSLAETGGEMCLLSFVFSVLVAFQYPIYFKFGYTKARFLALVPFFIVFFGMIQIPVLAKAFHKTFTWEALFAQMAATPLLLYVLPVVGGLAALFVSCLLSSAIYAKRDI